MTCNFTKPPSPRARGGPVHREPPRKAIERPARKVPTRKMAQMHSKFIATAAAVVLLAASPSGFAPREPVSDTYFGTPVVDAYRYMERVDDPRYVAWLGAEAARTRAMLTALPDRPAVEAAARAS